MRFSLHCFDIGYNLSTGLKFCYNSFMDGFLQLVGFSNNFTVFSM